MVVFLGTQWSNWTVLGSLLVCLLIIRFISGRKRIPKGFRLPPGPPGKLLFGNAADMPTNHPWEKFTEWRKEYGDLVYVKVLNMNMIFVNSADIAHELFEKRSSIYSDRFDFPMMNLMGFEWDFGIMPYGERWRRHRKTFNDKFHQTAVLEYQDLQVKQTRKFLAKIHETPNDYAKYLRLLSGSTIMELIYGIQVLEDNDPYIATAEQAAAAMGAAGNPGAFLVDTFPILRHVPAWMPGAGFQRQAAAWKIPITETAVAPYEAVRKRMLAGDPTPSILGSVLEDLSTRTDAPPDEIDVIRNTFGIAYLAGADTTVAAMTTFWLAMILYPEVQRKAQEELDTVVGLDRLPDFEDRESLPYINAICSEVHRWHPVAPLGVAHRNTQDDVYGDIFIPEGSVVVGNSWAMLHDEAIFGPEPDKFNPDRFLDPTMRAPTFAFGFGRRICPGRYLADNSLFIAVASVLKVFNITRATDSNGKEIPVSGAFTSGFVSFPEPFECAITPRIPSTKSLVSEYM